MTEKINHPAHYLANGVEVIDFIESHKLGFSDGNAVKYLVRAGKKNPDTEIEDLEKALWYIDRLCAKYEKREFPKNKITISVDDLTKAHELTEKVNEVITSIIFGWYDTAFAKLTAYISDLKKAKENLVD